MDFSEWFDLVWRRAGEHKYPAIFRLAVAATVDFRTILRALRGAKVNRDSARKLAGATEGCVDALALMDKPSLRELQAQQAQQGPAS